MQFVIYTSIREYQRYELSHPGPGYDEGLGWDVTRDGQHVPIFELGCVMNNLIRVNSIS